jgi:hypothetical protein
METAATKTAVEASPESAVKPSAMAALPQHGSSQKPE